MPSWPISPRRPLNYSALLSNAENWRRAGQVTLMTTGAWSSANLAVYTPLIVPNPLQAGGMYVMNGGSVSGSFDLGLYASDAEGKPSDRLWHSGPTVQTGTNLLQGAGIIDVWIHGLVYLACSFNNAVGQVIRLCALTNNGSGFVIGSIFTEAAAYQLPATATPNPAGVAVNVPLLGLV